MHYTGWLIPLSIFGFFYAAVTMIYRISRDAIENDKDRENILNTPISFIYGIVVILWLTFFNESWKRAESIIADKWLVNDEHRDSTTQNKAF